MFKIYTFRTTDYYEPDTSERVEIGPCADIHDAYDEFYKRYHFLPQGPTAIRKVDNSSLS